MEKLLLPTKIEYTEKGHNRGQFIIEPCYYGYGMTIGNALRRVLLSSLPGAAITAVKINGVEHEFSTMPHIKEDVVELILNFKKVALKVYNDEPVKLLLKVKGEKEVKAGDIEKNSAVEIVNPELHLAYLTDSKADLSVEIIVNQGRGYVPTEQRSREKLDLGMIAIDAIYTPVMNVGFKVSETRVGQITNYDSLQLEVETNGSITPEEAFHQAVEILLDHFNLLAGIDQEIEVAEENLPNEEDSASPENIPETKTEEQTVATGVVDEREIKPKRRGRPKKIDK